MRLFILSLSAWFFKVTELDNLVGSVTVPSLLFGSRKGTFKLGHELKKLVDETFHWVHFQPAADHHSGPLKHTWRVRPVAGAQ